MKETWTKIKDFLRLINLRMILLIILLFLVLCWSIQITLQVQGVEASFLEVLEYNLLAIAGNDYQYTDLSGTRWIGLIVLTFGVFGLSAITGYISSALVARKLNLERGTKRMKTMKGHIIICGWKSDIKILMQEIMRKNKGLHPSDLILINNADDLKIQTLREDPDLRGLNILRGDYTEEQTLMSANVKEASKVLIIGENQENLDAELIDSRVFVCALLIRNLNPKCHICAEIKTERYKNYLEAQNCAEVIYTEEYTRYILTTSTNYSGMSKVMSSFLDNGDGVSVQIAPIGDEWIGRPYGELFAWYKEKQNILLLGVLENMGVEKELKHRILADAQKSTNYGEIIKKLKDVKTLETNEPHLNPADDYILRENMGAIILGEEL
ncbi:MAG: NAD-binding protein [Lachnospiraceae bacterium]|nr:NAD-binding protein [Lachnospiraceae bacterium]